MLTLWKAFDDLARSDDFSGRDFWTGWPSPNWPAVDVVENEREFIFTAEMPGMKPEEVDVKVHGNVLTLKGEHKVSQTQEKEGFQRIERRYGKFERSFGLPENVDASKIDASLKDGMLTVTIPKRGETVAHRVQVKAGELADKAKGLFTKPENAA